MGNSKRLERVALVPRWRAAGEQMAYGSLLRVIDGLEPLGVPLMHRRTVRDEQRRRLDRAAERGEHQSRACAVEQRR